MHTSLHQIQVTPELKFDRRQFNFTNSQNRKERNSIRQILEETPELTRQNHSFTLYTLLQDMLARASDGFDAFNYSN